MKLCVSSVRIIIFISVVLNSLQSGLNVHFVLFAAGSRPWKLVVIAKATGTQR